ncbi:hypothetical protein KJ657_01895 [Patescibacteria group bacterium]|nr:hypothetical protein [Patescibacteria group bacterium]MBU1015820.1 hypothetical protein [Patescibacteria group bacterium]MBU1685239.1 hypothetical protein [Patescibacteria group bacterium]MBU1938248.1 hypothetical protein [Patescibacteria group bacterium]
MNEDEANAELNLNRPADKEYVDIIRFNMETGGAFTKDTGQPAKIVYYCRECKKIVTPKRIGKKLSFRCSECDKEEVSFGTEKSITSHYNIK